MGKQVFKDSILDHLAREANVAAFVSFNPNLRQRFSRVYGFAPNHEFQTIEGAIESLLSTSPEKSVNIRSFHPTSVGNREFIYGLRSVDAAIASLKRVASTGLHTIVNETVDINDGGVSGVVSGSVVEFAPHDTPRCVERPGVASLHKEVALQVLKRVYHVRPKLDYSPKQRVEFSLHPKRRGIKREHTIIWEIGRVPSGGESPLVTWPNEFSKFIGDKTFGLLVSDALGLRVPSTLVIPRWLPPFRFGVSTGTGETWMRTAPVIPNPGKFLTLPYWKDPFRILQEEDPENNLIASVLAQEGVKAKFSGSQLVSRYGRIIVEGVVGTGEKFMMGVEAPSVLPSEIIDAVKSAQRALSAKLGPVRSEWVHDGKNLWIIQLHRGATVSTSNRIVPGKPRRYVRFFVEEGIQKLRLLVENTRITGDGIVVVGNVGITSHIGDLLRRAGIPSYIEMDNSAKSAASNLVTNPAGYR